MQKVKRVKVEVYSLGSSAKRPSPDSTQLPPGHRTCLFISRLNSPGSIRPGCHFRHTGLFTRKLHCPTRYPLTPGSRECTCGQTALPRSTTSEHNSAHAAGQYFHRPMTRGQVTVGLQSGGRKLRYMPFWHYYNRTL